MRRDVFEVEHEALRASVRSWLAEEVTPYYLEWERDGSVPHSLFAEAGKHGFLGMSAAEEFGGGGVEDFRYNQILDEEIQLAGVAGAGVGLTVHNDVCLPYFQYYCNELQKERWLPGLVRGELVAAIAMTEPGVGSDLGSISTTALRDGDRYIVNGSKTFISNGINSDLIITAVKTNNNQRHRGISLLVLERGMSGFERGRNLEKLGLHSQDTAELFFSDVSVPAENLLGEEGQGFLHLVQNLPRERISVAISALAAARYAFDLALPYVKERKAFGQAIGSFQNSRFVLAEIATEIEVAQAFVDKCVVALNANSLNPEEAAMSKWWCTELQNRAVDRCLQLFGGYGYMMEYPIARAYADARITRIYGGTTEIMKEIIGRGLGL